MLKETQIYIRRTTKDNYEDAEEKNYTQYIKMENPKEEIIFDEDENKYENVIIEEKFYCAGVWRLVIEIRPVERIEPQCDNEKYICN